MEPEPRRYTPPDQETVAYRGLCLGVVIMRAEFEQLVQAIEVAEVWDLHQAIVDRTATWMADEGLTFRSTARERALLAKPLGSWTEPEIIDMSWRLESLGILLWALSLQGEISPDDDEFDQSELIGQLNLGSPVADFLARARLRPTAEIEAARVRAAHADLTAAADDDRVTSIAVERHFALNWLCGYSDDWESTPTDT